MITCEHKFGLKKRSNELYCPVCRATVLEEEFNASARQGRNWWGDIEKPNTKIGEIKKL